MSKTKQLLLSLLAILIGTVAYNVYDNRRFVVVEQTITLGRLPASFDGFRVLQISDLHGRTFGDKQARLVAAINNLEYDMIALTGDMNRSDTTASTTADSQAILDLLDGIKNKEYVFWIDGNTGPYAFKQFDSAYSGQPTAIGRVLQDKGCTLLLYPYPIRREQDQIWITPAMSEMALAGYQPVFDASGSITADGESLRDARRYYRKMMEYLFSLHEMDEVKISLQHAPRQMDLSAAELEPMGDLDYDLILSGHYHGGQWRLPLLGSLYVPSPTTGINGSGIFPSREHVKGLTASAGVPQHISAGLGASGHRWWTGFRLFNTPEINLITLERE